MPVHQQLLPALDTWRAPFGDEADPALQRGQRLPTVDEGRVAQPHLVDEGVAPAPGTAHDVAQQQTDADRQARRKVDDSLVDPDRLRRRADVTLADAGVA